MSVIDSAFWQFALALYRDEALRRSLLVLQDAHQVVILEWLFAVWLADQGLEWRADDRQQSRQCTAPWVDEVIVPLRQLRRRWCASAGRDAGYRHLLAMELAAEQHLADLLLAKKPASEARSAGEMLLATNTAWLETEHGVDAACCQVLLSQLAAVRLKMR